MHARAWQSCSRLTDVPALPLGQGMTATPIILVPGFWLGAWAWDHVVGALRADGHAVTALTLPGLDSADVNRSAITLSDHVDAICGAVRAADARVVLAVHSASGFSGYAASDRVPERIAAMVYVDTAPGKGALDAGFEGVEKPLDWKSIEEEENVDGLSEEQKETFRQRAVPTPGGVIREVVDLTNDARLDIPSTIICTGVHVRAVQGRGEGRLRLARRHPGAPECHLDRPADEPLADVVTAEGAREHHRRGRDGARPSRLGRRAPTVVDILPNRAAHHPVGWCGARRKTRRVTGLSSLHGGTELLATARMTSSTGERGVEGGDRRACGGGLVTQVKR